MTGLETRTISVSVYRDSEGNPTCAKNFVTREVCEYLGSRRCGTIDVCMLGQNVDLHRYRLSNGEEGCIKPHNNCKIWKGE